MTMPSELLRSIPREVRLTAAGRIAAIVALLLFLAAVIMSAWFFALTLRGQEQKHGTSRTTGRIVRLNETRGDHPRWVVTYRYDVDGHPYQGTARLGRRDRQHFEVGEAIGVNYLAADPETHWIDGYESPGVPAVVAPFAFVAFGSAGLVLLIGIRRQMALLSYGRPALALVTGARKVGHGEHRRYRLSYTYGLLSGATQTGSLEMRKKPPAAGSEIIILYDPDNPKRRARYPMSLVRCVTPS